MNYKLSEIMDILGGGTPKTSRADYWNGDIPWLSVKDFNNDYRYVYKSEKTISEAGLNNSSTQLLQRDDIIISAKEKMAKPDIEFFKLAINRFNHKYDKIFFMDDNPINVKASYDAGMIGILYKDYDSFIKELSKYIEL